VKRGIVAGYLHGLSPRHRGAVGEIRPVAPASGTVSHAG
jgi:hypothetical protein